MLEIPSLGISVQTHLGGTASACFASDLLPNQIFFALQEQNALKLIHHSGQILVANAHTQQITALEFTQYGGNDVLFSGGLDGKLKAWTIDRQQSTFTPIDQKDLQSPVLCLQMLPNNVLVAGLQNGTMSIWNLNDNSLNAMPAHPCAITCLFRKDQYLVSGDMTGNIRVLDANSAATILESPPAQQPGPQSRDLSPILSITILEGPIPIIVAGD